MEPVKKSEDHDRWFREQVQKAIDDNDFADCKQAEAQFARQRASLRPN